MFTKFLRSPTFLKYIISYTLVLVTPILLFLLLIQTTIIPQMRSDLLYANNKNIESTRAGLESKIQLFTSIALNLSANSQLTPYNLKQNYYQKYKAIAELKKYHMSNDITENIFYYLIGDDRIHSASNESGLDVFFDTLYPFQGWDSDFFLEMAGRIKSPEMIKANTEQKEYLLYIVPVENSNPYALVFFLIESGQIQKIIDSTYEKYNQSIIIFDKKGNLIYTGDSTDAAVLDNQDLLWEMVDEENRDRIINLSGINYLSTFSRSIKNGWTYLSVINDDILMGDIDRIRIRVFLATGIIFIIGLLVVISWSFKNYKPIYEIHEHLQNAMNLSREKKSELASISSAVNSMIENNQKLRQNLENYKPILREYSLRELIQGRGSEKISLLGDDPALALGENPFYGCIVISSPPDSSFSGHISFERVSDYLEKKYNGRVQFFSMETIRSNYLIIVISLEEELLKENRIISGELCSRIQQELELTTMAGIGRPYGDILSLGKSYMEADSACNSLIHGKEKRSGMIYFDDYEELGGSGEDREEYPHENLNILIDQLGRGNYEAEATLQQIAITISDPNIPSVLARCISLDILNRLMTLMMDLGLEYTGGRGELIGHMTPEDDGEDYMEMMTTGFDMARVILEHTYKKNTLRNKMQEYIGANFADPMFSVESMAAHFHMSDSQLCLLYKANTNQTILSRIWELRLSLAQDLLAKGDMKIKDVIIAVGYYDASTFIRKFKSAVGVTPGQYRKSCAE